MSTSFAAHELTSDGLVYLPEEVKLSSTYRHYRNRWQALTPKATLHERDLVLNYFHFNCHCFISLIFVYFLFNSVINRSSFSFNFRIFPSRMGFNGKTRTSRTSISSSSYASSFLLTVRFCSAPLRSQTFCILFICIVLFVYNRSFSLPASPQLLNKKVTI